MGDSSASKRSIPDWQTTNARPLAPSPESDANSSVHDELPPLSKERLFEQAKRFLEDESIVNATRERKVVFLQKKGIQGDDIEKLLGSGSESLPTAKLHSDSESKIIHDSTAPPSPVPAALQTSPLSQPSPPEREQAVRRDIPPIITYPEFLLKPQKPPPLVTLQRLTYAAYTIAGITSLTYGASKFLIQPMLQSLTDARHELADLTLRDLQKLNSRLETNVSVVPKKSSGSTLKQKVNGELVQLDDVESIDSDPTELFHRDMATQTSPQLSRSTSSDTSMNLTSNSPTEQQSSRLFTLHSTLSALLASTSATSDSLKESISDFQNEIDTISMSNNPYQLDYNSIYPRTLAQNEKKKGAADNSESAKFKAEIRSLKGALLSSTTLKFPVPRPTAAFGGVGAGVGSSSGVGVR